jgi:hypothetical protein
MLDAIECRCVVASLDFLRVRGRGWNAASGLGLWATHSCAIAGCALLQHASLMADALAVGGSEDAIGEPEGGGRRIKAHNDMPAKKI